MPFHSDLMYNPQAFSYASQVVQSVPTLPQMFKKLQMKKEIVAAHKSIDIEV